MTEPHALTGVKASRWIVYGLADADGLHYVGCTRRTPAGRRTHHASAARCGTHANPAAVGYFQIRVHNDSDL